MARGPGSTLSESGYMVLEPGPTVPGLGFVSGATRPHKRLDFRFGLHAIRSRSHGSGTGLHSSWSGLRQKCNRAPQKDLTPGLGSTLPGSGSMVPEPGSAVPGLGSILRAQTRLARFVYIGHNAGSLTNHKSQKVFLASRTPKLHEM